MKIKIDKKRIILKTATYVCAALVLAAAYRSGGSLPGNDRAAEELPKPAESLVKVENEEIRQMPIRRQSRRRLPKTNRPRRRADSKSRIALKRQKIRETQRTARRADRALQQGKALISL